MNGIGTAAALYIHVPFCAGKCPYCDFYSKGKFSPEEMTAYVDAVCRCIKHLPKNTLHTIYFGGGTPSLLRAADIGRILDTAAAVCGISSHCEITLEANPNGAAVKKIPQLAAVGVNRLSLGLQSSQPHLLRLLGRRHTPTEAAQAVSAAYRSGISNVSLDLMWALPHQSEAQLEQDIRFCGELGVPHISAYLLKIEAGTPFDRDHMDAYCPSEDTQADLYLQGVSLLESLGYQQYEISSFAKGDFYARHNTVYWKCQPYYGIGPSAHGFTGTRRYYYPKDLASFVQRENPWTLVVQDGIGGGLEEQIMLGLRLTDGISLDTLSQRFPHASFAALKAHIPQLTKANLVKFHQNVLRLTPQGMLLSNQIIGILLDDL